MLEQEVNFNRDISRRQFIQLAGTVFIAGTLSACESSASPLPSEQEILSQIKELHFTPGSQLRTTFCPRKEMWESAQYLKMQGNWSGGDSSNWMQHTEIIEKNITALANAGFKGGRLAIFPFELTNDGNNFDFSPIETALDLMNKHDMTADFCVGPFDYPYGPGIRVPKSFQERLQTEVVDQGENTIIVSLSSDPKARVLSADLRDYELHFLDTVLKKYGDDPRIAKFYLGNEWPDKHGIEGVSATMSVSNTFMEEAVARMLAGTDKEIALNTNIYAGDVTKLQTTFGKIFTMLGKKGILGIDAYPTREAQIPRMATQMKNYGHNIQAIRNAFPGTDIVFTEFQGELYAQPPLAGKSWADIEKNYPTEVKTFFQRDFPPTLKTYVVASGIKEVGIWGAPLWYVTGQMGYTLPLDMMHTIADTMDKKK
ncbi:MAG TPA: hypothetical protein VLF89_05430 [Candidatus Saccharimonadales bacterium]|nr:hypothetical protein [Candidatus Saccharimonadales bacterium]